MQGYDAAWRRLRIEILRRDDYTCHYCGKPSLTGSDATVDHVVPFVQQGRIDQGLRLDPYNCVAACRACNSARARNNP